MPDQNLPPSLATKPNIPWREQTTEQLIAERDYWKNKIDTADSWGASLGAAMGFYKACLSELARRNEEPV